ncbi:MAG: alpha/beta hydrolase [Gammaproteobacteria bacterium]|nr:alpha/beta hydrolase [Gammaproteobacteria bacterium]
MTNPAAAQFNFQAQDGLTITVYQWLAENPRAAIIIAHGAAEHAARYARVAAALVAAGYSVYAIDHRGHGATGRAGQLGVFADTDGWNRAVDDLLQLSHLVRERCPGVPMVLFGHSMGSLMTQQYVGLYGDTIDAAVLSGSTLANAFAELIPALQAEVDALGRNSPSKIMAEMMGQGFNDGFEDARTGYEWLSRDHDEVQAYIDDPLCGFELSSGAWLDMFKFNRIPREAEEFAKIPRDLPIYLFAGDADPINQNLATLHALIDHYTAAGLHVEAKFYQQGRHEMLNEINREEVTQDLLNWLDKTL